MTRRGVSPADVDAELEQLYDRVPVIDCKGPCRSTCTVIEMSDRERQRIAARGIEIPPLTRSAVHTDPKPCVALGAFGQCTVHDVRPMICRIWGVTEDLPCVYGCVPADGEYLSMEEAFELLGESLRAGGAPARLDGISGEVMRAVLRDPVNRQAVGALLDRGHAGDVRKAAR